MSGLPGNPATNASGIYTGTVAYNWSGTVTPTLAGYTFSPANRAYTNVTANLTYQDYTATLLTYTISGTILMGGSPLAGVVMSGLPGNPATNASGVYTGTVTYNWSGTVTPTNASGSPLAEFVMSGLPSNKTANDSGVFSAAVTPPLAGFTFNPVNRVYSNVRANQTAQDYSAIPDAITLTAPNGGESWTIGESQTITWTSTGTIANVNIDYSTNNGSNWTPIVASTANDGSYCLAISSTPSTTCLVRVRTRPTTIHQTAATPCSPF